MGKLLRTLGLLGMLTLAPSVAKAAIPYIVEGTPLKLEECIKIPKRTLQLTRIGTGNNASDKTIFNDINTKEDFIFTTGAYNKSSSSIDGQTYYVQISTANNTPRAVLTWGNGASYGDTGKETTGIEAIDKGEKRNVSITLNAGQQYLNPKELNKEITNISVGGGFGTAQNQGVSISARAYKNLWFNLDISKNSQRIDAVKEEIATGKKTIYGHEALESTCIDSLLTYELPVTNSTSIGLSAGVATTQAYLESANESDIINGTYNLIGGKVAVSASQRLGDFIVKLIAAYRTGKHEKLDMSAPELRIGAGMEF